MCKWNGVGDKEIRRGSLIGKFAQDVSSGPATIKLEHTFAAMVALKVFP